MFDFTSNFSRVVAVSFLFCTSAALVCAADLAKPKGDVVLTLSGAMTNTNGEGNAAFDLDMLRALPVTTFKTKTTWTEGDKSFTGVSLQALLTAVGSTGSIAKSIALNDYSVDIPVTDAVADGPVIAYLVDNLPMSVRDKGPLWIVYPYDAKSEYRTEETYSKSIWQLSRIELK